MKKLWLSLMIVTLSLTAFGQYTGNVNAGIVTGAGATYDPGHTGRITVQWVQHLGEQDLKSDNTPEANDHDNYGLILSKNDSTSANSAVFAHITHVDHLSAEGIYGFDFKNASHCGAGAPRFNVITQDNVTHFIGGCANGTLYVSGGAPGIIGAPVPEQGWQRVYFDSSNPAQAFPVINPGDTIKQIYLVFDEGADAGPDFSGQAVLDNINVPGSSLISEPRK